MNERRFTGIVIIPNCAITRYIGEGSCIVNPMDEKGFGRNCDNSEQHGIRCIGEGSIVMESDALARTRLS